jgi:hypothetical protein
MAAACFMASGLPTEVPPNFMTSIAICHLLVSPVKLGRRSTLMIKIDYINDDKLFSIVCLLIMRICDYQRPNIIFADSRHYNNPVKGIYIKLS